ncbi:HPP family protein [Magnetospirillum sulfuroxidans]|uniref:HPP family protein n=1 Tax=Magnetospirillum sulfuroxidans TaxID=611300 RepID=A0ABS5IBD0_9PROT|nr:HPP family protein [Magnetospirillum sulfuroxidans]MBR9971736.1 HPP family protein [Magnetospirillum sulfuroxidans]
MMRGLQRLKGGGTLPPRPLLKQVLAAWFGGLLAIAAMGGLTEWTATPWLMAPFGATAVIVFGLPDSPLAQPRNVIFGHLLSTVIGLVALKLAGPHWWSMAMAVATAIAVMQVSRTVHPPAGANPLVVMLGGADWGFLVSPVLIGTLVMVAVALASNNVLAGRRYPLYWGLPNWRAGS